MRTTDAAASLLYDKTDAGKDPVRKELLELGDMPCDFVEQKSGRVPTMGHAVAEFLLGIDQRRPRPIEPAMFQVPECSNVRKVNLRDRLKDPERVCEIVCPIIDNTSLGLPDSASQLSEITDLRRTLCIAEGVLEFTGLEIA